VRSYIACEVVTDLMRATLPVVVIFAMCNW
jgi:hypothetical protein